MSGFTLGTHYSFYPSIPPKVREQDPSSIYSRKTSPSLEEQFAYMLSGPGHMCRNVLMQVTLEQAVDARVASSFLDWLLALDL